MKLFLIAFATLLLCSSTAYAEPISSIQVAGAIVPNSELRRARQAYLRNDPEACLRHLKLAKAQQPNLPPADLMLARLMLIYGNTQGRLLLEQVARSHDSSPEVYLTFADIALNEGRIAESILHLNQAEKCRRPDGWNEPHAKAFSNALVLRQVAVAESRSEWDRASELLNELIRNRTDQYDLRVRLALDLLKGGKDTESFSTLKEAESLADALPAEIMLSRLLISLGKLDEADARLKARLKAMPSDPAAHLDRAVIAMRQDNTTAARRHLNAAKTAGGESRQTRRLLGLLEQMEGNVGEATKQFQSLLTAYPTDEEIHSQLALALARSSNPSDVDRALKMAKTQSAKRPSTLSLAIHGWIMHRMGDHDEARRLLQQAFKFPNPRLMSLYFWTRHLVESDSDDAQSAIKELRAQVAKSNGQLFVLRRECQAWLANQPD